MTQRRTNRGQVIDFELLQTQQGSRPAVGNMGTDGKGNVLGPGGEIVATNEQRVRKYLKDNPAVSNEQVSLKASEKNAPVEAGPEVVETKTAKTAAENVRTKVQPDPEPLPEEPDEFGEPDEVEPLEPLGYNEVQLPNGDIDMVPYYNEEDKL